MRASLVAQWFKKKKTIKKPPPNAEDTGLIPGLG